MDILDSIKSVLAPPHKAGYPFILGGIVVAFIGLIFWHPLAWLGLIFTLFCLYFFRDPERVPPPRSDVFLAPADGLVVSVGHAVPPPELGLQDASPRPHVAIFLSVLDVHVNRMPITASSAASPIIPASSSTPPTTRLRMRTSATHWRSSCPPARRSRWCRSPA